MLRYQFLWYLEKCDFVLVPNIVHRINVSIHTKTTYDCPHLT